MRRKMKFWQLRMIFLGICLCLVMEINAVKADEIKTQEIGETVAQENGKEDSQLIGEGNTKESDGENSLQDIGQKGAVKVEEIDLGDYQVTMEVGESQLLTVTVLPVDAADQTVYYASSNEKVASVNSMGRIRANAVGTAKIKVSCSSVKSSFYLTVSAPKDMEEKMIAVTDIEISDYEKELEVDKTMMLTATVLPANATETVVSYRSSDPNIATVNSGGEVKGIAKGDVIIYCSAGGITREAAIKVKVATEKMYVDNNYFVLKPGENKTLKTTVSPADASQAITYKSSDVEIAEVSAAGVVTAKSCGNTSIIISNKDISISVSVIVNESAQNENTKKEKESENQNTSIEFLEKMDVFETPVITSEMLNYFYRTNKTLSVHGAGYTILICGEDIVNDKNELLTQILFHEEEEGTVFEINEGKELCGTIFLYLDRLEGNYLYLYNTSKGAYQLIDNSDMKKLKLTTGGKYLLTDKRLSNYRVNKMAFAGGALFCFVVAAAYIMMKKKYWFWWK